MPSLLGLGLPGGDPRGDRIEEDVLRSMIRRENRKDRKRTGARMVRESSDSLVSWWGVDGRGEPGGGPGLVAIVEVGDADTYVFIRWENLEGRS